MYRDVVFVHGTGVRSGRFVDTFASVLDGCAQAWPGARVHPCYWGDSSVAVTEQGGGGSIPGYEWLGGGSSSEDDAGLALWALLPSDPLRELRALASTGAGWSAASIADWIGTHTLSDTARSLLAKHSFEAVWDSSVETVLGSAVFSRLDDGARESPDPEVQAIVVRAVVAEMVRVTELGGAPAIQGETLETVVNFLYEEFDCVTQGVGKLLLTPLWALAMEMYVGPRRGKITDSASGFIGDILKYQAHGAAMRDLIRQQVEDLDVDEGVVLIGHSLGGIACVELLVEDQLSGVDLLVTVGSQAPFLYELDVLAELRRGERLPAHFPSWRNVYDDADFLSFKTGDIFDKAIDIRVDNRRVFPSSHSAYFTNASMWHELGRQ